MSREVSRSTPDAAVQSAQPIDSGDGARRLSPIERRASVALAGIYALRMLGLFMVLPVFATLSEGYAGYTPLLAGLGIGVYGLAQALFQIPFGMWSDRIGRKPVIVFGLVLFAIGSVVAAVADSLPEVIVGRAIQGAGAVAAAIMALAADLTREEQRTKAMAIIGASIGGSFVLALVVGPLLAHWVGLSGIFWVTALLVPVALAVLVVWVPTPTATRRRRDASAVPDQFAKVLQNSELLRLDLGIFVLHAIVIASFTVVPLLLRDGIGLKTGAHWQVYACVLAVSLALMAPFVLLSSRQGRSKRVFVGAVVVLAFSQLLLVGFHSTLLTMGAAMVVFFAAFNLLEATLPSLVSRVAPPQAKGTALGVYSTCQFFGAFVGGVGGGWVYGMFGAEAVFWLCAALAAVWLAVAATMRNPDGFSSQMVNLGRISEEQAASLAARLAEIRGVAEAVVIAEEGIAYLKVNRALLDEQALRAISAAKA